MTAAARTPIALAFSGLFAALFVVLPARSDGEAAGCTAERQCGSGLWCDYPPDAVCGASGGAGICLPRPDVCTRIYLPVCGCDGKTYGNACEANSAGVDIRGEGEC